VRSLRYRCRITINSAATAATTTTTTTTAAAAATAASTVGRDSVVGIATRYVLDGPRIGSRTGRGFSAPFQTVPGTNLASYTMRIESLS